VWAVVVPVKRLAAAKSRLRGVAADHTGLVLAMAEDTVRAVLACSVVSGVLVVSDDAAVARTLGGLGTRVVPDSPAGGLNAAIRHGAGVAGAGWVAALAADLPALRPEELTEALSAARARAFVADASGTGTTLLVAPPGVGLDPRFGPGSAARHAASGAVPLAGNWPTLRRDVDTPVDLAEAERLGLGPATAAVRSGQIRSTT
jgi:2-phospho-L-lactate guanylyltransferase